MGTGIIIIAVIGLLLVISILLGVINTRKWKQKAEECDRLNEELVKKQIVSAAEIKQIDAIVERKEKGEEKIEKNFTADIHNPSADNMRRVADIMRDLSQPKGSR